MTDHLIYLWCRLIPFLQFSRICVFSVELKINKVFVGAFAAEYSRSFRGITWCLSVRLNLILDATFLWKAGFFISLLWRAVDSTTDKVSSRFELGAELNVLALAIIICLENRTSEMLIILLSRTLCLILLEATSFSEGRSTKIKLWIVRFRHWYCSFKLLDTFSSLKPSHGWPHIHILFYDIGVSGSKVSRNREMSHVLTSFFASKWTIF